MLNKAEWLFFGLKLSGDSTISLVASFLDEHHHHKTVIKNAKNLVAYMTV